MPLPILELRNEPKAADLVRLFHQTDAHWVEHLADPHALEVGTAYANPELAERWDANNIRDAALPPGASPTDAVAEVDTYFAGRGCSCSYWVMNPSANESQTRPLVEHLLAGGLRAVHDDILYLRHMPREPIAEPAGVRFIPARASYRHVQQLMEEKAAELWGGSSQFVASHLRHLDDPHVDAVLALAGQRPVAYAAVMAVGELGRIEGVYVAQDFRGQGIGRALMGRALEVCARSLFKHVFLSVDPSNEAGQRLYRGVGFERVGELVRYARRG
jgi:ribosomal protein S18 acetylase RimI-like enzyme